MKTRFFLPLAIAAAIFTAQPVFAQSIPELFQQGVAAQSTGNFSAAEQIFRRVIDLDPNNAGAYTNLGNALSNQGNLAEAIVNHRNAIRLNPNYALAYNNLGTALGKQGDLAGAIINHRTAIRLDPNLADAYYNLGVDLGKQGNLAEAITNYRTAIRLDPNLAFAYINLGAALYTQGNVTEAITNFRTALRLAPNDTDVQNNLRLAEQSLAAQSGGSPGATRGEILRVSGVLDNNSQVLASDGSLFNSHTFSGQAGQVVEINLTSTDFDTYLALVDANRQVLGQNDDVNPGSTNSFLRVTLPSNGSYTIVVNGLDKTSRGRYNLSVIAP